MSVSGRIIRGIRDSITSGLIGRASSGSGPAELIPWSAIASAVAAVQRGKAATNSTGAILPANPVQEDFVPAGGTTGQVLTKASDSDFDADWEDAASGSGDVVGPASSTAGDIAQFDGTTGKLLKDTGLSPASFDAAGAAAAAQAAAEAASQPVDADLTAIAALSGTGILVRTAANTWALRTIQAGTNVTVTDGDGVSGDPSIAATGGSGSGTVTSVAMTGDGTLFNSTVPGSPVTTSGTFAPDLLTQSANLVFAGPSSGSAAPTFRSLVASDLPTSGVTAGTYGDATHVCQATFDAEGRCTSASNVAITGGGGSGLLTFPAQGRPTLVTGTPIMTSSVTGQTTVYFTPYKGSYIPIYDGTSWTPTQFTEMSQLTTDTSKSPAACVANSNYDLFVWSDSGTLRCTRGPLWSSDTARGTGAGTTELVMQDGVLMNANAITNGPAAKRGVYVGTIRTNGSSAVDYILGGPGASGGESTVLGLWSYYNRVLTKLVNFDSKASWTYTTATYRAKDGSAANEISLVIGLSEDQLYATNFVQMSNSATTPASISIGLNSTTTVASAATSARAQPSLANGPVHMTAIYSDVAPLGFNFLCPLEESSASGTATWFGAGNSFANSNFFATVMA